MSSDARRNSTTRPPARNRGAQQATSQLNHGAQVASIVAGILVALLAIVYCAGCVYFHQRFWPNTVIGDADVSGMTAEEAKVALQQASDERSVSVSGQGVSFSLTGANAGLQLNVDAAVSSALAKNASWQWPFQILCEHDDSDVLSTSFDTDLLRSTIDSQLAAYNSMASDPADAFLYYDESSGSYQVNPGSMGTKLDVESVMQTVMEALANKQSHAALTSANLVQQSVKADDERLLAAQQAANAYLACSFDLTVNGSVVSSSDGLVSSVTPSLVQQWIVVGEDFSVTLDEGQLAAWVSQLEAFVDTVGDTHYYTRPDGKYVTVYSSGKDCYGWVSDGASLLQMVKDAVYGGTVGSAEIPFNQTAATFAAIDASSTGAEWAGMSYVDIDLSEQHVYYYDAYGNVLWETDCITGEVDGEHETPTGVYYVNAKMVDQVLVGLPDPATGEPEYRTPVNYWMPFIDNLYALHDNPYTDVFGPGVNTSGGGSHGCVNLPLDKAAELYGMIEIGTPVVVHY